MPITDKLLGFNEEVERKEILNQYRYLLRSFPKPLTKSEKKQIRMAFEMSLEAHQGMRRKSGEPYILHPLEVARISVKEINLGPTAVICALLHDVVEDTEVTLEDLKREFGNNVMRIVDGLTKISGVFDVNTSAQAENFRKILLTLADDVQVILIKIADRLHNMRTLNSMPKNKQQKISSETLYIYAPLAHRLGLYAIKSEMEDLSMKYLESETYKMIAKKLEQKKRERQKYISDFIKPVKVAMEGEGITCKVYGRPKSIFSIWHKMKNKGVEFEEVYDLFAIRIIIDTSLENEKSECWRAYSAITDIYTPNPNRLRDWISTPKANGYESLHTTVMGPKGRWVEVQIRSKRMDEIAEKGYAAHWMYKEDHEGNEGASTDVWLSKIREMLNNPESNALDFLDDFKLNLFNKEMYIFTPKGDLKVLPRNSTALDFAFDIHTDIGSKCIGAKVNHKLVPLSHKLNNGDQVEIITSNKQKPNEDWLNFVTTGKAKSKIRATLREEKRKVSQAGRLIVEKKLAKLKFKLTEENLAILLNYFNYKTSLDFFYDIAEGKIQKKALDILENKNGKLDVPSKVTPHIPEEADEIDNAIKKQLKHNAEVVLFDGMSDIDYKMAKCCTPIPGDDVFGFITIGDGIKIHRANCPNAVQMMSNYSYRIVKTRWVQGHEIAFLTGLKIKGIDDMGLVNKLTNIISGEHEVNIRSISIESNDGVFEGMIMIFVNDTKQLKRLMKKLKSINGVLSVTRFEN